MEPTHSLYLSRCIQLAKLAGSKVYPNPRVGAVIVHQNRIIGEGFHPYAGGPHAEVSAVAAVKKKELLTASTLYVSLEPCNHHGKTPPCTDLILQHQIPRVVVGCQDPNPQVAGKGIARLQAHGVDVILADDPTPFEVLIQVFRINQLEKRPFITLKWAESTDGFIARIDKLGNPVQAGITGRLAQEKVHQLRAWHHTIMVGKHTARIDNPRLSTRLYPGENPIRIVWDQNGELPYKLHVFTDGHPTWILGHIPATLPESVGSIEPSQWADMKALVEGLYQEQGISSILVEGGRHLLQQFIDQGVWDEVYQFVGGIKLGKGLPSPTWQSAEDPMKVIALGKDLYKYWRK